MNTPKRMKKAKRERQRKANDTKWERKRQQFKREADEAGIPTWALAMQRVLDQTK